MRDLPDHAVRLTSTTTITEPARRRRGGFLVPETRLWPLPAATTMPIPATIFLSFTLAEKSRFGLQVPLLSRLQPATAG